MIECRIGFDNAHTDEATASKIAALLLKKFGITAVLIGPAVGPAVCTYCSGTYQPKRTPTSGQKNICGNEACFRKRDVEYKRRSQVLVA